MLLAMASPISFSRTPPSALMQFGNLLERLRCSLVRFLGTALSLLMPGVMVSTCMEKTILIGWDPISLSVISMVMELPISSGAHGVRRIAPPAERYMDFLDRYLLGQWICARKHPMLSFAEPMTTNFLV